MKRILRYFLFFNLFLWGFHGKVFCGNPKDTLCLSREALNGMQAELRTELGNKQEAVSTTLSIAVLIFGFLTVALIFIFLMIRKQGIGDRTMKLLVIVIALSACLFLITAGYSRDQVSPAIALIGTIAGYILGSKSEAKE